MEIKNVSIDDIAPDQANVRLHDTANLVAIKASLLRFGQQKPIVIDSNKVIRAGNGTWQAAKELGWETIDVVESKLERSEMTAYAIADNRTAELATWDQKALDKQLESLDEELRNIAFLDLETPDFQPGTEDDQGQLDEKKLVFMECPNCGKEFEKDQAKITSWLGDP